MQRWRAEHPRGQLQLLDAVRRAVAVDPDARLAAAAAERGWPVIALH